MNLLPKNPKKRKTLILKPPIESRRDHVIREQARFMVWREGGDAPVKIYDDPQLACTHAKLLCKKTGEPFHVFRSWRIIECVNGTPSKGG